MRTLALHTPLHNRTTRPLASRLAALVGLCAAAAATACHDPAPPPPLPRPPVTVSTSVFGGTAVSGPVAPSPTAGAPDDALLIEVWVTAAEALPEDHVPAATARLLCDPSDGQPRVIPRLLDHVRAGAIEDRTARTPRLVQPLGQRTLRLARHRAALPRGTTLAVAVQPVVGMAEGPALTLRVHHRDDGSLDVAVVGRRAADPAGEAPGAHQTELMLLDPVSAPTENPMNMVVASPPPYRGTSPTEAFVFEVRAERAPGPESDRYLDHREAFFSTSVALLAQRARQTMQPPRRRARRTLRTRVRLRQELASSRDARAALVGVARHTGARWLAALALSADDAAIVDLRDAALAGLAIVTPSARLGHALDQAALASVLALAPGEDNAKLSPAVEATLLAGAGAVGRQPPLLRALAAKAQDSGQLEQRLVLENRYLLGDRQVSTRLRAYEWLAARGDVVAGFDPFGERGDRRRALRRYADSLLRGEAKRSADKPAARSPRGPS